MLLRAVLFVTSFLALAANAQDASSLRGRTISTQAPTSRQAYGWDSANLRWFPTSYMTQAGSTNSCIPAGGSTTAYTCGTTPPLTSYSNNMPIYLKPDVSNTACATLNIDGVGAAQIHKVSSGVLVCVASGDIIANVTYLLIYNGSVWVIQLGGGGGSSSADCQVTILGAVATIASPCNFSKGGITQTLAANATFTLSGTPASSTAYFYWAADGTVTADENTAATGTCNAYCTAATTGGFPSQSTQIASATFVNNVFTAVTDLRAIYGGKTILPGSYMGSSIDVNGQQTLTPVTDTTNGLESVSCAQGNCTTAATMGSASGTTMTCNPSPAYTSLANNTAVWCKADTTSTGAVTLNVSSLGAKKAYKLNGTTAAAQLTTGEIIANQTYLFTYNTSLDGGSGGWQTNIGGGATGKAPIYFSVFTGGNNQAGTQYGGLNASYTGCTGASLNINSTTKSGISSYDFVDAATNCAGWNMLLPRTWDGGTVRFNFSYFILSGASNGQATVWTVETGCTGDNVASVNGPSSFNTQTITSTLTNATAGFQQIETLTPLTMTGCNAGDHFFGVISRTGAAGGDTATATASLTAISMELLANLQ